MWRKRERMEMVRVMEMVVVMIVRGGLLLCLQHSIPGTYNLNIKIIQKLNTKVILPSNAVFYLLKKNAFHSGDYIIT